MAPARRGWRPAIPAAVVGASLSVCAGLAFAAGGGITPPDPPKVTDVVCISNCGGVHKATTDSKVQVSGRHLRHVSKVLFTADQGGRIGVNPVAVTSHLVTAKVPEGAATGRPKVTDSYDTSARSPTALKIVGPGQIQSGNFKLRDASAKPRRTYYYGTRNPRVTYMFTNSEPTEVRIDVVKRGNGTVVDSWVEHAQEPNTRHTAKWTGIRRGTKKPVPNGKYKFRVGPQSGSMESTTEARFKYHRFKFPIRGRHAYGDGVGAPRVGHTHQGQDVFARCGAPLVAARGGRVQWKAYQAGGAGYYLVIDGKKTGHDYVYMHLKGPAKVDQGQRVKTGQRVGKVGSTGAATGCHLHFEEWTAPGWYQGGRFMRAVTKHLKKWDRWS
jgi:murein DD-endopeptidase MepM/ murein hydrolase activator NlpD